MTFKTLVKQEAGYFCDVCKKRLNTEERASLQLTRNFFGEKFYDLCPKHSKPVRALIKNLAKANREGSEWWMR